MCWACRRPCPSLGGPDISSEPLLRPSPRDSLTPAGPAPPLPLAWPAQHHQPVRQAPACLCSPLGARRLSVRVSHPRPQSIPVSPRRRPPDCSRCCRHRCVAAAAAGRERVSERAREGGGGFPLLSGPHPSPTRRRRQRTPPPPLARLPPLLTGREPCVPGPALPGQPAGGPLIPPPCPFSRAPPRGAPFPSPGPLTPTVTGGPGRRRIWRKRRGLRGDRTRDRQDGWRHPDKQREGRQILGGCT